MLAPGDSLRQVYDLSRRRHHLHRVQCDPPPGDTPMVWPTRVVIYRALISHPLCPPTQCSQASTTRRPLWAVTSTNDEDVLVHDRLLCRHILLYSPQAFAMTLMGPSSHPSKPLTDKPHCHHFLFRSWLPYKLGLKVPLISSLLQNLARD